VLGIKARALHTLLLGYIPDSFSNFLRNKTALGITTLDGRGGGGCTDVFAGQDREDVTKTVWRRDVPDNLLKVMVGSGPSIKEGIWKRS
jgi:hypothetical protein